MAEIDEYGYTPDEYTNYGNVGLVYSDAVPQAGNDANKVGTSSGDSGIPDWNSPEMRSYLQSFALTDTSDAFAQFMNSLDTTAAATIGNNSQQAFSLNGAAAKTGEDANKSTAGIGKLLSDWLSGGKDNDHTRAAIINSLVGPGMAGIFSAGARKRKEGREQALVDSRVASEALQRQALQNQMTGLIGTGTAIRPGGYQPVKPTMSTNFK